ncbi:type II secretion system secretin GspD [Niveibacterium sp. SC-1]|uniref:type II secretion system secretin GspD n=1 Tax=Niveibacterium sp. SC-1 TaxID=3135646 RepID=UPI00311F9F2E
MSRTKGLQRRCASLATALFLCLGTPVAFAQTTVENGDKVALNFVNADIEAVIRAIGKISGKNFLIDPRVKGTLNITTQQPVPRSDTYAILLSALRLQGYTAVEGKGVVKILPEVDAKVHGVPVGRKSTVNDDRIVTQVFQIKHESAVQLMAVVRPLVTPNNTVTAYAGNNTLVITDYAENLARIGQVIGSIDVPQGDVRVIPVENASAVDLANTINRLLADAPGGAQDASQRLQLMADARTNSLLVRSENPSKLASVRQLVATLDKPGSAGNVRVVYLKNAEATKMARTLQAVISGENYSGASNTSSGFSMAGSSTTGANNTNNSGGQNAAQNNTNFSNNNTGSTGGTGGASANGVAIQAEPASNALIITAPEPIYNNLRKVIDQLDRRRAQVYVEALIAEITADNAAEFGVQWTAGEKPSDGSFVGAGTSFGDKTAGTNIWGVAANPSSIANGLNVLVGKGTINIPGVGDILNLQVLARVLETRGKTNILSTPTLLMLDNEEAKIVVGRNLPFVTGSYANTGGGTTPNNPFTTVERQDVGLTLRVKPQITEGGVVKMLISQENSSVASLADPKGPITNKRSIDSTVLVDDGAIVALGGLIEDNQEDGTEKVPYLGDVPVLGSLFRYDQKKHTKTNLVVFLRPKIIRDGQTAATIANERYDQVLGLQRMTDPTPNVLMPGPNTGTATLPDRLPPPAPTGTPTPAPTQPAQP